MRIPRAVDELKELSSILHMLGKDDRPTDTQEDEEQGSKPPTPLSWSIAYGLLDNFVAHCRVGGECALREGAAGGNESCSAVSPTLP